MVIAAVFFVLTVSPPNLVEKRVEIGELNHIVGDSGEVRFSQFIIWRWYSRYPSYSGHHVAEWHKADNDMRFTHVRGEVSVTWRGSGGKACRAVCRSFKETWTFHDPEVADQKVWPTSARRPYFGKSDW